MENRQINFFKSKDINTVLKPFKKGTEVKIDSFDARENQKELNIGLFGWYAICPSKELKKISYIIFHFMMSLLFFIEMKIKTLGVLKIFVHIEGPPFLEGHYQME